MTTRLQHLNQTVESLHHLQTAMVLDNERHLELWMLLQFKELPGVEVSDKITVMTQHSTYHHVIQFLRQIMQSQPEQRETDQGVTEAGISITLFLMNHVRGAVRCI